MIHTLLSIAAPVAIMIACGVLGGYFEALADARKILANKKVDHVVSGVVRVGIALLIGALCAGLGKHFDGLRPTAMGPLFAIIGLSAFNPVFRYTMNKKRKLDARYVSPKSKYDRLAVLAITRAPEGTRLFAAYHDQIYNCKKAHFEITTPEAHTSFAVEPYRALIHRAGRLAYIAEISCLITSALLYGTGVILTNTN